MGLFLFLNYLYFAAYGLAWFLLGSIVMRYVFIDTRLRSVGIIRRLTLVDMEDGTGITVDSNSLYLLGQKPVVWDFPPTPPKISRFIGPSSFGKETVDHGVNGRTLAGSVD